MSTLLAIDPGLAICGFAVFEDDALKTCGVIRTNATQEYGLRLCEIMNDLSNLIHEHCPDAIAIEKLFSHFKNKSSMEGVSAARGCVFMLAAQCSIPVHEYTATAVKAAIAGNGRADKREMQLAVSRKLHIPILQPDDAADAVAIGLTHLRCRQT